MGEDRLKGSAKNLTGRVKEGAGNLAGDQKLKREGVFEQFKGKVQNAFGNIKDAIRGK